MNSKYHILSPRRILLLFCLIFNHLAIASSTQEELAQNIKIGRVIWLNETGNKTLSVLTESAYPETHGNIILIHDIGNHLDWPQLIKPLRVELPQSGWPVLSVQAPESDEAFSEQMLAILQQAIETLTKNTNLNKTYLVAHGRNGSRVMELVQKNPTLPISGLVLLGPHAVKPPAPPLSEPTAIQLAIPFHMLNLSVV